MTPVTPTQCRSSTVIGRLRNVFTDVKSVRESLWDSWISEELKGFWEISVVGHESKGQDSAKMLFQASVSVGDVLKMAFQCIQPDADRLLPPSVLLSRCSLGWGADAPLKEMQEILLATEQYGQLLQTSCMKPLMKEVFSDAS